MCKIDTLFVDIVSTLSNALGSASHQLPYAFLLTFAHRTFMSETTRHPLRAVLSGPKRWKSDKARSIHLLKPAIGRVLLNAQFGHCSSGVKAMCGMALIWNSTTFFESLPRHFFEIANFSLLALKSPWLSTTFPTDGDVLKLFVLEYSGCYHSIHWRFDSFSSVWAHV